MGSFLDERYARTRLTAMRTEHGGEASDTVNVVVEVDLAVLVTVALDQRVERGVAHLHTCTENNTLDCVLQEIPILILALTFMNTNIRV